MKACVYTRYGSPDVLELKEVEKPTVTDKDVLIRIHASSVNAYDWHMLRADPFLVRLMNGLLRPKNQILGADIAGKIEKVGKAVTRFNVGDAVFGDTSGSGGGGFGEYVSVRSEMLSHKPENLSFEEAAAVPLASVTALQGLRNNGHIQAGQKVMIHGASGGVGTFAVQIAKAFGADVTAVCSTKNTELARELGADRVIDYTREDFVQNDRLYNLIYAANGNRSIFDYLRALKSEGTYVSSGGSMKQAYQGMLLGPWLSMFGKKKIKGYVAQPDSDDLGYMTELIEAGKVRPVIDRKYKFNEIPEAIRYLEDGHARGKVVIGIHDDN
jgi:NADPH:quinone reductase-like Zn-dependent oxidoreductase